MSGNLKTFRLFDELTGLPKADASPVVVAAYDRRAGARPHPILTNMGDGLFGVQVSQEEVALGVAWLVDAGAGVSPRHVAGVFCKESSPFHAVAISDNASGELWGGDPPTVTTWQNGAGDPLTSPGLVALAAPYFYAIVPRAADLSAGVVYVLEGAAGSTPPSYAGSFSFPASTPEMGAVQATRAELIAAAGVTALVGERIYALKAPQAGQAPFVILGVVSAVPQNAFEAGARLVESRLQVDAYAKTYLEARAIDAAVTAALTQLHRSDLAFWKTNERDLYDNETSLHRVSCDFSVWK